MSRVATRSLRPRRSCGAALCFCAALACALLLGGCDQFARVGVEPQAVQVPNPPSGPRDAAVPPQGDAAASADAGVRTDAAIDADASTDAAVDAGATCSDIEIAGCDPVRNIGCSVSLAQQCAIDQLATLTGYCIFVAPSSLIGGECLNTGVTEDCPATSTCFETRCRKICLCDADCDPGQCCTDPVGATAFLVCGEC